VASLSLPGASQGSEVPAEAAVVDGRWQFKAQRQARNPLIGRYLRFADRFWRSRGVPPCGTPTIWLAEDLGGRVMGRASQDTCEMWLLTDLVREAQRRRTLYRLMGQSLLCQIVLHERGHLGGLNHSASGVMSVDGIGESITLARVPPRPRRAYGDGPCSRKVARDYNAGKWFDFTG